MSVCISHPPIPDPHPHISDRQLRGHVRVQLSKARIFLVTRGSEMFPLHCCPLAISSKQRKDGHFFAKVFILLSFSPKVESSARMC